LPHDGVRAAGGGNTLEAEDVMRLTTIIFCCFNYFFFSVGSICYAQKQVIFLQRGNVIARFTEGDYFKFRLKDERLVEGYVTELTDFNLITAALDTIPFLSIEKFSLKDQRQKSFLRTLGRAMLVGGIGYIAIDQANVLIGTNKSGFDDANRLALVVAGVGAGLSLIKFRYKKVARGVTIRTIDYRSPYYKLNR
jgi:hypothetical protein